MFIYVCIYACVYVRVYMYVCVCCVYVCMHVCTTYVRMYVCMHARRMCTSTAHTTNMETKFISLSPALLHFSARNSHNREE